MILEIIVISAIFICIGDFEIKENPHDAGKRGVINTGHGACRTTNSVVLPKKVASKNC